MSGKSTYFQRIVREGAEAHAAGVPLDANPYGPSNTKGYRSWAHGWQQGEAIKHKQIAA